MRNENNRYEKHTCPFIKLLHYLNAAQVLKLVVFVISRAVH